MTIKDICDIETKCTGCSACAAACPTGAIRMTENREGFLEPLLDSSSCTSCGLCAKVCGFNQEKARNTGGQAFIGYARDPSIRVGGSSGGFFGVLSQRILAEGGVVYGAVMDCENKRVCHRSTAEVSLSKILRSKYVQSDMQEAYQAIKTDLLANRRVLFCGTPCQVRALKLFLGLSRVKGDLVTVDFFCHGVPSNKLFKELLEDWELETKSKIVDFTFREKDIGWRTQVMKAYFENGEIRKEPSMSNFYYYYFVKDYSLRDSCYTCTEYTSHASDITMADYWRSDPKKDGDLGVSLLVANTEKGGLYLGLLADQMVLERCEENGMDYDIYSHAKYKHRKKEKWLRAYEKYGYKYVRTEYFNKIVKKERNAAVMKRPFVRLWAKYLSVKKQFLKS